ncbi:hypothetical protein CLOM_g24667, partial [Closterium sp. NIES-68]
LEVEHLKEARADVESQLTRYVEEVGRLEKKCADEAEAGRELSERLAQVLENGTGGIDLEDSATLAARAEGLDAAGKVALLAEVASKWRAQAAELAKEKEKLLGEKGDVEARMQELEAGMGSWRSDKAGLEKQVRQLDEGRRLAESRVQEVELQLSAMQELLDEAKADSAAAAAAAAAVRCSGGMSVAEIEGMRESNQKARRRIVELEGQVKALEKRLEEWELEAELQEANTGRRRAEERVTEVQAQLVVVTTEARAEAGRGKELEGRLHRAEAREGELMSEVQGLEGRVKEMEREKERLGRVLGQEEAKREAAEARAAAGEAAGERVREQMGRDLARLKEVEGKLTARLQGVERDRDEAKTRAAKAEEGQKREKEERQAAVARLQAEVQLLTQQLSSSVSASGNLRRENTSAVEAAELRAAKGKLEDRLRRAEGELREAIAERNKAELEVESQRRAVAAEKAAARSREAAWASEAEGLKRDAAAAVEAAAGLRGVQEERDVLLRQLGEAEEANRRLEAAREELEGEKRALVAQQGSMAVKVKECERVKSELVAVRTEKQVLEERRLTLSLKLAKMEQGMSELEDLRARHVALQGEMGELAARAGERKAEALAAAERQLDAAREAAAGGGGGAASQVEKLENQVRSLEQSLETSRATAEARERSLTERLEQLEASNELLGSKGDNATARLNQELRKAQQQLGEARVRETELRCALAAHKGSASEAHEDPRKSGAQRVASGVAERMAILETELAEALEANNSYKEQLKRALASAGAADSNSGQQSHEGELAARLADMAAQLDGYKWAAQTAEDELARVRAEHEAVAARLAQADVDKKGRGEAERRVKADAEKKVGREEKKEEKRDDKRRLASRPASPRGKGLTSTATPASASAARLGRSSSSRGVGLL